MVEVTEGKVNGREKQRVQMATNGEFRDRNTDVDFTNYQFFWTKYIGKNIKWFLLNHTAKYLRTNL